MNPKHVHFIARKKRKDGMAFKKQKTEGDYAITVPKDSAFRIKTPDDQIRMHALVMAVAKRGGGKTVALTSLLKSLKKDGALDRLFLISPTYESNKDMFKGLPLAPEDIYHNPYDLGCLDDIIEKAQKEMDEYKAYKEKMALRNKLLAKLKATKSTSDVYDLDPELLLDAFNYDVISAEPPFHKWKGRRPVLAMLVDDCQGSPVLNDKRFQHLCLRHRHVGGGLGISIMMAVQNFKGKTGGMPLTIRDNLTHLILFRTKNGNVLKDIFEEIADDITEEEFYAAYNIAIEGDEHAFLFIDFHPKKGKEYRFRKNFDEYIVNQRKDDGGGVPLKGGKPGGAGAQKAVDGAGGPADGKLRPAR
jgi:hypothetical protein